MSAIHAMKSAVVEPGGRRGFGAQYAGNCHTCGGGILPGDKVFYAPGNESPSGLDCCGDKPDAELVVYQLPGDEPAVDDEPPNVVIDRVMPRGKTKRDMCPKCWQIPANNGSCGCDY